MHCITVSLYGPAISLLEEYVWFTIWITPCVIHYLNYSLCDSLLNYSVAIPLRAQWLHFQFTNFWISEEIWSTTELAANNIPWFTLCVHIWYACSYSGWSCVHVCCNTVANYVCSIQVWKQIYLKMFPWICSPIIYFHLVFFLVILTLRKRTHSLLPSNISHNMK